MSYCLSIQGSSLHDKGSTGWWKGYGESYIIKGVIFVFFPLSVCRSICVPVEPEISEREVLSPHRLQHVKDIVVVSHINCFLNLCDALFGIFSTFTPDVRNGRSYRPVACPILKNCSCPVVQTAFQAYTVRESRDKAFEIFRQLRLEGTHWRTRLPYKWYNSCYWFWREWAIDTPQ